MEIIQHIEARRSIRAYTGQPVTEEQVRLLLEAAMSAPSAHDTRPWAFVVVCDPEQRRRLAETHRWSAMAAKASVVFAVVGNPAMSEHWVEDCSAATENILLAATGLGLGGVWVGIYPVEAREETVRRTLKIPQGWRPLCLVPVGYPAEEKPPRTRYEEEKVHHEIWHKK
ncbi:MAG: nitroreductase family protein [Anaerolineae bacterium]|nr:nitroreductase family protein [Anaerolineae bacterium]